MKKKYSTKNEEDLKCLFIACKSNSSFDSFVKECRESYSEYCQRNLSDLNKYGWPKNFSQWINGQIIALT